MVLVEIHIDGRDQNQRHGNDCRQAGKNRPDPRRQALPELSEDGQMEHSSSRGHENTAQDHNEYPKSNDDALKEQPGQSQPEETEPGQSPA